MIFDTHAHYDDAAFDTDRDQLLAVMQENGIGRIVNIGVDPDSIERGYELSQKYSFIYTAVGVHPSDINKLDPYGSDWVDYLREKASRDKVVAIGEIGLDYYWEKDPDQREKQKRYFREQLALARELDLPFSIHSREAARDTLDIAKEEKIGEIGGVMHCYSYSREIAREYLNMGFYIGVGGVITFKNGRKLREVVEYAPIEQIVLETDSPYLAPEPFRGKRNSSLNLPYVVEKVAEIKKLSPEEVIEITERNAKKLYGLK